MDWSLFLFCSEEFEWMPFLSLEEEEIKTKKSAKVLLSLVGEFEIAVAKALQDPYKNLPAHHGDTPKFCRSMSKNTLNGSFWVVVDWNFGTVTEEPLSNVVCFTREITQFVTWIKSGCMNGRTLEKCMRGRTLEKSLLIETLRTNPRH
jgi:hypothetical protein